jgi:DNA primase
LIVPHQFGVRNVVASLGTALTPEQARLLGRFARKVVINYDGDKAGIKAAKRAIETLLAEDFEIKVLALPDGADPDEFLRAHGAEEYQRRRGEAYPHMQFVIEQALHERDLRVPAHKADAVDEVLPFLRAVKNRIQKREYFDMTMDALRVEEKSLRQELWKAVSAPSAQAPAADDVKRKVARAAAGKPTLAETKLLELLIHDEEVRRSLLPHIEKEDYQALPTGALFQALQQLEQNGVEISFDSLNDILREDPAEAFLPELWMAESKRAEGEAADVFLAEAESCVAALRLMRIDRRVKELAHEIAAADRAGENERRDRLTTEDLELKRYRTALLPRVAGVTGGAPFD